jgi:hypothetical protein
MIVVLAGVVVTLAGAMISPRQAAATFFVAYLAALSVVLGVVAMTMIANLTTATWFDAFRADAALAMRALPALAVLGVAIPISLPVLFPWYDQSGLPANDVSRFLNAPFFIARWVVYWVAWIAIDRSLRLGGRDPRTSALGLVVLGITMTFAAFDWMMSLTPDWSSTIYGVYWFAGAMVSALALLGFVSRGTRVRAVSPETSDVDSLAKLLLTFTLFWLYTGFSQYIVIWSGGLPREVGWYVARARGAWAGVAAILLFAGFLLPFSLLMLRALRRSGTAVRAVAGLLLAVHYLDTFWLVIPGLVPVTWWTMLLAVATFAFVLGALLIAAHTGTRSVFNTAEANIPRVSTN